LAVSDAPVARIMSLGRTHGRRMRCAVTGRRWWGRHNADRYAVLTFAFLRGAAWEIAVDREISTEKSISGARRRKSWQAHDMRFDKQVAV
jgi:hypothetical protein